MAHQLPSHHSEQNTSVSMHLSLPDSPLALYAVHPSAYVWFACNFDDLSFCGWTMEDSRAAQWIIHPNWKPSIHQGPTHDHTGSAPSLTFMLCCCCCSVFSPRWKVNTAYIFWNIETLCSIGAAATRHLCLSFLGRNKERREDCSRESKQTWTKTTASIYKLNRRP